MPVRKHRSVKLLVVFAVLAATIIIIQSAAVADQLFHKTSGKEYRQHLPLVFSSPITSQTSALDLISQLRANAGVPAISYSPILERNCFEHARYMAENGKLTHSQDPDKLYASSRGQTCARQANIWFGSAQSVPPWQPRDAVQGWMSSVPHRIWLLYPTTKVLGFGFYTSQANKQAAAALDILSEANFGADEAYQGWPVRYPGNAENNIPATQFPITLNWRYFGPAPILKTVRLKTGSGKAIAHEANTDLSSGHKGIQIIPTTDLPAQSKIIVAVSGQYDGSSFSYSWHFRTGDRP